MDRELAGKRAATILPAQTGRVPNLKTLPRKDYLEGTFHEKQALMARVHKMARSQEIGTTYRLRATERGWRVEVIRLREPGRRWRKPVLVTLAVLTAAGAALWVIALAVQALAVALAALLPVLLAVGGLAIVVAVLSALSSGNGTTITQSVKIK